MTETEIAAPEVWAIYLDMGTTNTSGWLMRGSQIIARASRYAGVGDTARDGSAIKIRAALREIITELGARSGNVSNGCAPVCVAAAGMISSSLGLAEVPHVRAPASMREIAAGGRWIQLPDVAALPILLVPGVCSGPLDVKRDSISEMDVMRGEESLCIGLKMLGLTTPLVVLNLGSHWKAIQMNAEGHIESSITSLSGELIHAAQTHTILAGAVLKERARVVEEHWKQAGMKEQRRSGLPRALFCVRLLELASKGTPEDRLAFLIGAFLAADLDALISRGVLNPDTHVVIVGVAALAEAWRSALAGLVQTATVLTSAETEKALLSGIQCILMHAWHRRPPSL